MTLTPLTQEHAEATLALVQDPEVADNLGLRGAPSIERTRAFIDSAQQGGARSIDSAQRSGAPSIHGAASAELRAFAILRGGAHVGNVVLDRIDPVLGTARLSIYVGARGAGIGRSAVFLALSWAFGAGGLYKVWLTVHADNERALRAYRAVGFREEGRLRGEFLLRGQRVDALYLGVLAADFHAANVEPGVPPCAS